MTRLRVGLLLSLGLSVALTLPTLAAAQEEGGPPQGEAIRVFLDCNVFTCMIDQNFFRLEIDFVNWVRDKEDSDVHLLVTGLRTGGGGQSFELLFMGRNAFEGRRDTLSYASSVDDTQDAQRRGLAQIMKIGLVRYVGETPAAHDLDIRYRRPEGPPGMGGPQPPGAGTTAEEDPWDYWVFSVSASGSVGGESSYSSSRLSGSVSANRITEMWKIRLSGRGSYSKQEFDYDDFVSKTTRESYSGSGLVVRSLTDHWSAGIRGSGGSSTFANEDLSFSAAPVLEYNFFPYAESTRRQFTFQYALANDYVNYTERTIYGKTEENRISHSLTMSLDLTQPWGSVNTSLEGAHFLDDFEQNHISLWSGLNVRLFRGLRLNVHGYYSRVRDRINVAAGELEQEEILLRLRQIDTQYDYSLGVGFSYTFGSVYNNVVNTRIGGGGGGIMIMY